MPHDKFTNANSMREGASVQSGQYLKHSAEPESDMSRLQESSDTDQSSATSSYHERKKFRRIASSLRSRLFILKLGKKKLNKYPLRSLALGILMSGLAGLAMTSSSAYASHPTVNLQSAAPFVILAGTPNITDAGNTSVIVGNVGLSPATAAGIGLFCPQVTGTIFGVDAAYVGDGVNTSCYTSNGPLLVTAKNDLTTAFNDAAGRTPVTTILTELGGQTLFDGTYNSASTTFQITSGAGPLILDGQGNPDAVFIFQMGFAGTGLTAGPASVVQLTGSAQACNVFWQVDTATIDTTAVFKGTIMALNSITVANGANIQGRLLARNGNVTLINDTISLSTCAATPAGSTSVTPGLPDAGYSPRSDDGSRSLVIIGFTAGLTIAYLIRKNRTV